MLKTTSVGRTSVTGVKTYLTKPERQGHSLHEEEWELYAAGQANLSEQQVGRLKGYLGKDSRALATDVSEDLTVSNWARQMDLTRACYQHDKPTPNGICRTYYHYVLSPNMDDDCDFETMRAYAKEWAEENFRKGERLHEYAIVYHDDNERGILHAHIVVNVTNKATGMKLRLSNDDTVALQLSAQEIGLRYGFKPLREQMETKVGARTRQPIYMDRKEREILSKGGYSWKWELRKAIIDIAPLSRDFDDFKNRMNRAGYDVNPSKAGYLLYTNRNGVIVKDSSLGARFYREHLENVFDHESLLENRSYTSWELLKLAKGETSWKEEIRRAVDAIAPTVMSIPELERELDNQYGIRLIINRRGITYQHPSGYFKARDISIGFRYTVEGLWENAIVAEASPPYPGYKTILEGSSHFMKHYLPRASRGIAGKEQEEAVAHLIYHDLTNLMVRNNLVRIDDVAPMLERRYQDLREEKAKLTTMRDEVMRWNHLAVLQSRHEKDEAYLKGEGKDAEPGEYNDTLIRYERLARYLEEKTGGRDPKETQRALSKQYNERLTHYQNELKSLNKDQAIYRNHLMMSSLNKMSAINGQGSTLDSQALLAAGKTLSKHKIQDFHHLERSISRIETSLDLASYKAGKAERLKRDLGIIQQDIRSYQDSKAYLSVSDVLSKHPLALNVEAHRIRFNDAASRLKTLGISEDRFEEQEQRYKQAEDHYRACLKERDEFEVVLTELEEAKAICSAVGDFLTPLLEKRLEEGKKGEASGFGGLSTNRNTHVNHPDRINARPNVSNVEEIPIGEATKRASLANERLSDPRRSKKHLDDRFFKR